MLTIKIHKGSEVVLKSYCLAKGFEIIQKKKSFYVRVPDKNLLNKILKWAIIFEVQFDEDEDTNYLYLTDKIYWELGFMELWDLVNFIYKIQDEDDEFDWRLFKD